MAQSHTCKADKRPGEGAYIKYVTESGLTDNAADGVFGRVSRRGFTKIDTIVIRTDGAARGNPGPAGIGAVISDGAGQVLEEAAEYIGEATNNVAEYSALILGLKAAAGYDAPAVRIYLDSELLVNQLNGSYKVKNTALKSLYEVAQSMLGRYSQVSIIHVPRAQNSAADRLANEAIDKYESGDAAIRKVFDLPEQGSLF